MVLPASTGIGQLHVESRHMPSVQVGGGPSGDIYDIMATQFGVRLLIGDVMGSGMPAMETGLRVLNAWHDLACTEPSLAGIAIRLHACLARSEHPERFVTALLVNFPVNGGVWAEMVCCGHPPPLLLRDGTAAYVQPSPAPPLGLLDLADGWCTPSMIPFGEGDKLLLYTDGVSEARDADGRFFALADEVAAMYGAGTDDDGAASAEARMLDGLMARLGEHIGERVADDILLLLVGLG